MSRGKRSAPSILFHDRKARSIPGRLFFRPRFPFLAGSKSSQCRNAFFRVHSNSRAIQSRTDHETSTLFARASSASRFAGCMRLNRPSGRLSPSCSISACVQLRMRAPRRACRRFTFREYDAKSSRGQDAGHAGRRCFLESPIRKVAVASAHACAAGRSRPLTGCTSRPAFLTSSFQAMGRSTSLLAGAHLLAACLSIFRIAASETRRSSRYG